MKLGAADFEYYKDKDKTRKNRIENFFTVGDVGLLDEDGYLFLRDRKNDMIISGGVNIYPAEIESEFLSHPKVGDVAVFGIPHEEWGEEVKAVDRARRRRRSRAPSSPRELLAWCQGPPRQVQDAEDDRLHRRDAARSERQALQAQAPRPVLGRSRTSDLMTRIAEASSPFPRSEPRRAAAP